jgi:hypothetical protein
MCGYSNATTSVLREMSDTVFAEPGDASTIDMHLSWIASKPNQTGVVTFAIEGACVEERAYSV